ncbi:MAG: HTH-type transcriptional regulator AcrR [Actinomycetota bacterium]
MPSPASGLKTRQALIDAARVFLGQGNSDVSIQEIAKAANVSVGSVYTYFADKRELFDSAAADALMETTPHLQRVVDGFEDPGMGFLGAMLYACRRPSFDPETARIILTVGPLGFTRFRDYFAAPMAAIQASVDAGYAKCDDVEAFVLAASGAYQNVLAHMYAGTASDHLGERVMWVLAQQLGYSREQYNEIVKYVSSL